MNCEQASNLFDAYLDGELSPSLETELGAHRLHCASCRHQLALMEVAGHVIGADADHDVELSDDFTDRLLACIEPDQAYAGRIRRRPWWIAGGALAAAAAVVLACTAWLAGPGGRVAGERHRNPFPVADMNSAAVDQDAVASSQADLEQAAGALVEQVGSTWNSRADSAQSLIEFGQMTIMQLLDRFGVDPAAEGGFEPLPESFDELAPADKNADDIEDL